MNQRKYKQFVFKDYQFDESAKELRLVYGFDEALEFTETYSFDFEFAHYDPKALRRAMENLFFMAGVSYYKMYIPSEMVVHKGSLDEPTAHFFSKAYQRGLGEFWYVNELDPKTPTNFPVFVTMLQNYATSGSGLLVAVGGGKDSLVTIELLKQQHADITTWSLNHEAQLTPLIERIGLPHLWVKRTWDPKIQELNQQDALNGHVPISAIFACVGTIVAILSGKRDVVMSNEQSANEATLTYQGVEINHQYSKTQEFEQDYQTLLAHHFGDSLRYYSLLRPFSELRIAELFAKTGFATYKDVFSSCNRAYTLSSSRMSWCGECPKCAFVFLALTPFVAREELEALWNGKNLLLEPRLETIYKQLLGIAADKPLECIGTINESRVAMNMAQQQYLELLQYHFDAPENYNWRMLYPSNIPPEILRLVITQA